jgi:2-keto-3-deoxy-6-phosphogluconate aldolase
LINEATIQEALKLGCDYIISSVVSPETIHASAKGGYQILAEIPY